MLSPPPGRPARTWPSFPSHSTLPGSGFALNAQTSIYVDAKNEALKNIAQLLARDIEKVTGRPVALLAKKPRAKAANLIQLTLKQPVDSLGAEGYVLQVLPGRLTLRGQQPQGVFLGSQTIRQLLPPQPSSSRRWK